MARFETLQETQPNRFSKEALGGTRFSNEALSAQVPKRVSLSKDIGMAIKETPEDIKIGTITLGANLLSSIKRRGVQLMGGGILPDDAVLRQFEAVKPPKVDPSRAVEVLQSRFGAKIPGVAELSPERMQELRREQQIKQVQDEANILKGGKFLPGAVASEALAVVTRLPDIGSTILKSKAGELQAQQDEVTLATSPITRLHRAVVQGGVPSIGAAIGISLLTGSPVAGLVTLGESEGGAAFQEQLEKGGSVRKSLLIGELSEAAEIGGEMLVFPKILKSFKEGVSIRKGLTLIAENATQEGITSFNQRFLEVFGTSTTEGVNKLDAAKLAFQEGVKAVPEGAFVGGATGGGVTTVGSISNAIFGEKAESAQQNEAISAVIEQGKQEFETIDEANAFAERVADAAQTTKRDVQIDVLAEDNSVTVTQAEQSPEIEPQQAAVEPKQAEPTIEAVPPSESLGVESAVSLSRKFQKKEISLDELKKGLDGLSEVREKAQPLAKEGVAFHGSDADFETFDSSLAGTSSKTGAKKGHVFFSDDKAVAESFGKNIKEVSLELENPLTIDAEGSNFDEIKFRSEGFTENINEIAIIAENEGHDGLIVKNVRDTGEKTGKPGGFTTATTTVVFDSSKIKPTQEAQADEQIPEIPKEKPKAAEVPKKKTIAESIQQEPKVSQEMSVTKKTATVVQDAIKTDITDPAFPTSTKHDSTKEIRERLGIGQVNSKTRRSDEEAMSEAIKRKIPQKALRIAEEINAEPRALSDIEDAGMRIAVAELEIEHEQLMDLIGETTDESDIKTLSTEAQRVENELDSMLNALETSGSEAGRALRARRVQIGRDFKLTSVLNRAKAATGKKLTEVKRRIFKGLTKRLTKAEKEIVKLKSEVQELSAKKLLQRGAKRFTTLSTTQRTNTISQLANDVNILLKQGCAN